MSERLATAIRARLETWAGPPDELLRGQVAAIIACDTVGILRLLLDDEQDRAQAEMIAHRHNVASVEWNKAYQRRRTAQRLFNLLAAQEGGKDG